jgi:hypothetical protein
MYCRRPNEQTSRGSVRSDNADCPVLVQADEKFCIFYASQWFITMFAISDLILSQTSQSTSSHTASLRSILILSCKLCLPLQPQYIYSLLCFITNNMDQYQFISDIHSRNTGQGSNLYKPSSNLSLYQRGTYYMGIKIFNSLPPYLKKLHNDSRLFRLALKDYLYTHSFYTLQEYYNLDNN